MCSVSNTSSSICEIEARVSGDVASTHSSFELRGVVFICVELHNLPEFREYSEGKNKRSRAKSILGHTQDLLLKLNKKNKLI